ncbi:RsmB/NOP family class I SAM-dependent RNA methyltransferase [Atopobium minutum]|uniref:RsmB/NOP family class I SAM-dependent RNA methyltransferase n=1 Tax=Atopobium minutum TaxID=1381 RepID=UPI0025E3BEF0|nr:transcription antitermination factor NusB [Atopobium minutum]
MGKAIKQRAGHPSAGHATQARTVALGIVGEVRRRAGYARDIVRLSPELRAMDARDAGFVQRLVLGVTLSWGLLDEFINSHATKPAKIQPQVRDALRIAAYELCYLQTPANAAVNQGVELVRSVVPRAAGMANAVLRRIAEQDAPRVAAALRAVNSALLQLAPAQVASVQPASLQTIPTIEELSLVMAAPSWLVQQLVDSLGLQNACEMALCAHEPAPLWLSANVGKHSPQEARTLLNKEHIKVEDASLPDVWQLCNAAALTSSQLVKQTDVVVSDLAARMICYAASPKPSSRILEIGQGRATKSLLLQALAYQAGGPAQLVGVDSSSFKTNIANRRLQQGWAGFCQSVCYDGCALGVHTHKDDLFAPSQTLPEPLRHAFDVVFVDAPCSGTGTMRRHPERAWTLTPEAVQPNNAQSIVALQLNMLISAASRVQKDGTLIYSTCSVLKQENEAVVHAFLQTEIGQHFELVSPLDAPAVRALKEQYRQAYELFANCVTDEDMFRSHPKMGSFDGHFCARFVRRA